MKTPGTTETRSGTLARPSQVWLCAALLVAAGAGVYANSFQGVFLFDDFDAIRENPYLRSLWPPREAMKAPPGTSVAGRPLVAYTLAVSYRLSGLKTWGYHLVNLVLHLAAGLLLFGLLRRALLSPRCRERCGPAATPLAFAAALAWLVHPLQTASVTYIIQRAEILGALFILLALYAALRRHESPRSWAWAGLAFAAALAGAASKEIAYAIPLLVFLADAILVEDGYKAAFGKHRRFYVLLGISWLVLGSLVWSGGRTVAVTYRSESVTPWQYLLTQADVLSHYLRLCVWPAGLRFAYEWPLARGPGDVVLPGLLVLALLGLTGWALARRHAAGVAGAVFFLVLAPTSSVMPLSLTADDHRMYLPSAAVLALLVLGGCEALRALAGARPDLKRPIAAFAAALLLAVTAVLGLATWRRNKLFANDFELWKEVLDAEPEHTRALHATGMLLLERDQPEFALPYLEKAAGRGDDPKACRVENGLASALMMLGKYEEARPHLERAVQLNEYFFDARSNLGLVLLTLGEADAAASHLEVAVALNPDAPQPLTYLGAARLKQGKTVEALGYLQTALKMDPEFHDAKAYFALAKEALIREASRKVEALIAKGWELCGQGKLVEGMERFHEARTLLPKHPLIAHYLSVVKAKAEEDVKRLEEPPPEALHVLATAYAMHGEFEEAAAVGRMAERVAELEQQPEEARRLSERVALFEARKPFPDAPVEP
ncbi:MAG: tetratricopeptide repeat protein [Planctomycetota bacterium]|nr:tetratricopeptide repeat protein [Planctomycetota bacterium]